jgi:predicted dehydrogenase
LAAEVEAQATGDFHEFLDDVDAVVVSSPNFLHHEHALQVARAGRHLFCEKPMGLNLQQARDIAAAVNDYNVQSAVGFSTRLSSPIQTMQRYAQSGELGDVFSLCSRRVFYMPQENLPGWRKDHNLSGGLLMEINIHEIDWMMMIGGEVESVYAKTWAANPTGPRSNDHIWVTLNFAGGAHGQHEGSWLSPTAQFFRSIDGTQGGMSTDEWGNSLYLSRPGQNRETIEGDAEFDLRGNFLDAIEGTAAPVADVNYAVKVMAVSEAIFQSAASGQEVAVSTL